MNATPSYQYFTFTTPAEDAPSAQLGRVLFTEMHASPADSPGSATVFPSGSCTSATTLLTPQDKALLYGTFDLQRCVGSTSE